MNLIPRAQPVKELHSRVREMKKALHFGPRRSPESAPWVAILFKKAEIMQAGKTGGC
jgi:hypothetical protein